MYTVFGYTDDCRDFEYKFDSFVQAVKLYKKLFMFNVVFVMRDKPDTCMFVK
jgi:hypothetical protein